MDVKRICANPRFIMSEVEHAGVPSLVRSETIVKRKKPKKIIPMGYNPHSAMITRGAYMTVSIKVHSPLKSTRLTLWALINNIMPTI